MESPSTSPNEMSTTVTVGFDASEASIQATKWAIDNAQDGALTVQIVMAYAAGDQNPQDAKLRNDLTLAAIDRACENIPVGRATVIHRAVAGDPVDVLLNSAEGSRLLVLGRHGVKSMIHSAMGSVGDTCARMAACPVVIVPTPIERVA